MDGAWAEPLAWCLIHAAWQQGLLALAGWCMVRWGMVRSAQGRYSLACGLLALAAVIPVGCAAAALWGTAGNAAAPAVVYDPTGGVPPSPATVEGIVQLEAASDSLLGPWAGLLVSCWLVGVSVFSLRLVGGWAYLQHLRWVGVTAAPEEWRRRLEELAVLAGVVRPVWLLESGRVDGPMLVGWLRPVILVPVGMFTGLSPAQVEAVLLHELAHVRRHDYLVNLLQSVVEACFYFSPGIWFLSRMIREEREHCCDDLAVGLTGDPRALGWALLELEKQRQRPAMGLAMAATGGSLMARVRRIVLSAEGGSAPEARTVVAPLATLALAIVLLLDPAMGVSSTGASDPLPEPVSAATHQNFLRGQQVVTLEMQDVTLEQACGRLTELTGLEFELPPEAMGQRVSVEFREVSATRTVVAMFNLLEMDHTVDPATGRFQPRYWEGSGPRSAVVRLTLPYFHARQAMYAAFKHPVAWTTDERVPLREGLRRLNELCGIVFVVSKDVDQELMVNATLPRGTVRDALHGMLKPEGLSYQYLDDSRVLIRK